MTPQIIRKIILISFCFTLLMAGSSLSAAEHPQKEQGFIDLSAWDFDRDGNVELNGNWEVYWGQLLTPEDFKRYPAPEVGGYSQQPETWPASVVSGTDMIEYATLRLTVNIHENDNLLALKLMPGTSALKLWANNRLITGIGRVSNTKDKEEAGYSPRLVSIPPSRENLELVVQISNYLHTGSILFKQDLILVPRLILGEEASLREAWDREKMTTVLMTSVFLALAVYHLVLYGFRRKDRSPLFFALYCLLWLYIILCQPLNTWLLEKFSLVPPFWLGWRLGSISYFMTIPVILYFLHSFFPKEMPKYLPRIYLLLAILSSFLLFFIPIDRGFLVDYTFHGLSVVSMIWGFAAMFRALRNKRAGAAILLAGFFLLLPFCINDILFDMRIISTGYFMNFGILLFIFAQAFTLAFRFSKAFSTSEQLALELDEKNIALTRLDKMKDEFLANTSHELRTPLSGIIGIADSMLAGVAGKLSPQAKHNLDMVTASGRRLAGLVNDILDFSRLKNRDLALNIKPLDLRSLVDTVLTVMKPLADAKDLSLVNTIPDQIPPVLGDEDRLQQILYNLVGNGIKFTEQGSVTVSASSGNPQIEVSVSDTGIGIQQDKLSVIFQSFEQVDSGASRKFGGTGLGLPITRHLVELHGGKIRVESKIGDCTAFFFTLPVAETESVPVGQTVNRVMEEPGISAGPDPVSPFADEEQQEKPGQSGYTVLVVDDEPVNLQVAVNHLLMAGHQVLTSTNGAEALKIIHSDKTLDLVLLDIMMPGMTGYEVCQKLRTDHSASVLPVVMLTARNRISDLIEGFESGANDYLTKPFSRKELLARVNSQLQQREAYFALEENLLLKRKLEKREKDLLELHITQRRLSRMLDAVDDAVLAVGRDDEICFCNLKCEELLGIQADQLIGRKALTLFDPESQWNPMLPDNDSTESDQISRKQYKMLRADASTIIVNGLTTPLQFDEEVLTVLVLAVDSRDQKAMPVLNVIDELNRNRSRIQTLEENLNGLLPVVLKENPDFFQEVRKIDTALEQLGSTLLSRSDHEEKRLLAVKLMNLTIDYWTESTGEDRIELARRSGLWNIHTNPDGWERAQTLERYLDPGTVPARPRLKPVIRSADYVLAACKTPSPLRDRLEISLTKLQAMW